MIQINNKDFSSKVFFIVKRNQDSNVYINFNLHKYNSTQDKIVMNNFLFFTRNIFGLHRA